jgi:hypothetical protein
MSQDKGAQIRQKRKEKEIKSAFIDDIAGLHALFTNDHADQQKTERQDLQNKNQHGIPPYDSP